MTGELFLIFYGCMMAAGCGIALWESATKRARRKRKEVAAMRAELESQRQIIAQQRRQIRWYREHV